MLLKDLQALSIVLNDPTEDTDLGDGVIISQHPAGVRNYTKYLVRRYKSIREQFLNPARMIKAAGQGQDAAIGAIDWDGQAAAAIEDRVEADTTFVALTLCKPKSLAELTPYETWVANLPDDKFAAALKGAQRVTYGSKPSDFFGQVSEQVSGMNVMMMLTPAETAADAT